MNTSTNQHFNQDIRRRAEFITPPNYIKQKIGSGGLAKEILDQADKLMLKFMDSFILDAYESLDLLGHELSIIQHKSEQDRGERDIENIIYVLIPLRSNGKMFNYNLVTLVSSRLISFLEVVDHLDDKALEIVAAFYAILRLVLHSRTKGGGGPREKKLIIALENVCKKYFKNM